MRREAWLLGSWLLSSLLLIGCFGSGSVGRQETSASSAEKEQVVVSVQEQEEETGSRVALEVPGRVTAIHVMEAAPGEWTVWVQGRSAKKKAPLYLLDGKPTTLEALQQLDLRSIERIEILKGEDAVNAYGARGAYGVVHVITTRRD